MSVCVLRVIYIVVRYYYSYDMFGTLFTFYCSSFYWYGVEQYTVSLGVSGKVHDTVCDNITRDLVVTHVL